MATTTRVFDSVHGRPAAGVPVCLERRIHDSWQTLAAGSTGLDGTVTEWRAPLQLQPGTYRFTFDIARYFAALGLEAFYPEATTVFVISDEDGVYDVPLLIAPYSYATCCTRG